MERIDHSELIDSHLAYFFLRYECINLEDFLLSLESVPSVETISSGTKNTTYLMLQEHLKLYQLIRGTANTQ